jgi:tRNA(Arg) A34 adenosine deaminase TadA
MPISNNETFIREAILLAAQARQHGNHPFGALLVQDGRVILTAENTVNTDHDQTRHAELNLVSTAARQFNSEILANTILYTSTEPCAMCAGAIYWTGIRVVVYGCSAELLGAMADGGLVIPCREIFARGSEAVEVIGPILEDDARKVHEDFWG